MAREEGRLAGREDGQRAILRDLVRDRFADLPADVAALIDRASSDELTRWARQLLASASLDDWLRTIGAGS